MDDLRSRAARFAESWAGRGDEKSETQQYWRDLLDKVLLIPDTSDRQTLWFERRTALGGFIDALMIQARVLVEQKSLDVDLDKPEPRRGAWSRPSDRRNGMRTGRASPPSSGEYPTNGIRRYDDSDALIADPGFSGRMPFPGKERRAIDYSEFDALPLETDMVSISKDPSHDGIRDMSSLEKAGEIVSARIGRLGGLRWESRIGAGVNW